MKLIITLNDIPRGRPVALFGAGQAGSNLLRIIQEFRPDLEVFCFIDSFKKGPVDGLPVMNLDDFTAREDHPLILITSIQWREIEKLLLSAGVEHYRIIPPRFLFPSAYPRLTGNKQIPPCENPLSRDLFTASDCETYRKPLESAEALLTHPTDRELFRILTGRVEGVRGRLDALADWFCHSPLKRQYFDFINYENISTIIEGGMADGADTMEFLKRIKPGGTVYGFEPNERTYRESIYRDRLAEQQGRSAVKVRHRGLWSSSGRFYLKDNGLGSSLVPEPGDGVLIETVSIDGLVETENIEKVDFIKMDIEGAELEALKGAVHCLLNHRPQLAICLYHRKEDFFEIPLFLDSVLDDYQYRLGHYTAGTLETVWYGMPKN